MRVQTEPLSLNRSTLYYQPRAPSPEEVALKHRIDEIYTAHPSLWEPVHRRPAPAGRTRDQS